MSDTTLRCIGQRAEKLDNYDGPGGIYTSPDPRHNQSFKIDIRFKGVSGVKDFCSHPETLIIFGKPCFKLKVKKDFIEEKNKELPVQLLLVK